MRFHIYSKGGKEIPSSRYRAYFLAEALESLGHKASVTPVEIRSSADFVRYLNMLISGKKDDIIFLQRTIYSRAFIVAVFFAWLLGRRFIFDIDDAVFAPPAKRTEFLGRLASLITCGSEPVLAWARTRNNRTLYLPNGLPLAIYTKREQEPPGIPVIGWIGGGPAHLENLKLLPPIFEELSRRGIAFRFKLVGASGDRRVYELLEALPDESVEILDSLNWADPREAVKEIQTFSVGIMPLTETAWNQAKHFKVLEYMACGVPVVASAAATIERILLGAGAGLVAGSEEEWVEDLTLLLRDSGRRAEEGSKGRALIERSYSSEKMAQTLLGALPLGKPSRSPLYLSRL